MRAAYATVEEYLDRKLREGIPDEDIKEYLLRASGNVDVLCYNRIAGYGLENLTPYQQETIKEVVCRQAEFLYENQDEIDTILTSYSINGVSAQFGSSWNVKVHNGVAMKRDVYMLLCQTGLCCRLAR